jgi:hypothetical protein
VDLKAGQGRKKNTKCLSLTRNGTFHLDVLVEMPFVFCFLCAKCSIPVIVLDILILIAVTVLMLEKSDHSGRHTCRTDFPLTDVNIPTSLKTLRDVRWERVGTLTMVSLQFTEKRNRCLP